jgi:hypothetical protein
MSDTQALEAKGKQSAAAKKATIEEIFERATADLFEQKKPHEEEKPVKINGKTVTILLRALGRLEYDKMLTECPPSAKQRAEGQSYDQAKFAPKLMAKVIVDPQRSEVDWRNTWNDENWNRAELGDLFFSCVEVCSVGVNVDPTESVSG